MEQFGIDVEIIEELLSEQNIETLKEKVRGILKERGEAMPASIKTAFQVVEKEYDRDVMERYLRKIKSIIKGEPKTNDENDIDLNRWQEYEDILYDTFWHLGKRDPTGGHGYNKHWGNFTPDIPRQFLMRFTKKNDWVLDPFLGGGTTLVECRRQGRNAIGVELVEKTAQLAQECLDNEPNPHSVTTKIIVGDNRTIDYRKELLSVGAKAFQLIIMHPPYWDIIKFSKKEEDLSNAKSLNHFLEMLGESVESVYPFLEKDKHLVLVMGDRFRSGEWFPLAFKSMEQFLKFNFKLKSIIVKNFTHTLGKRGQEKLWKYRALVNGFYIFKHEYIFLFKK